VLAHTVIMKNSLKLCLSTLKRRGALSFLKKNIWRW